MPQVVPLSNVANQSLTIQLGNQNCVIDVYQKTTGVFVDLIANGVSVVEGVPALNLTFIVRALYSGFFGDLVFNDATGLSDPTFDGFGSRYFLLYYSSAELPADVY